MQDISSVKGLRLPYSGKRRSVDLDQIIRLEGRANYTLIWFRDGSQLLVALTLKRLLLRLPAGSFIRPHRKHLVNRLFVVSVSSVNHVLHLASGETIAISRRKFEEVRRQLRGGVSATRTGAGSGARDATSQEGAGCRDNEVSRQKRQPNRLPG